MKNLSEWNESSNTEKYDCAKMLYEFAQKPDTNRSGIGAFFNENDYYITNTLFKEALKLCPEESTEQRNKKAQIYKDYGDFLTRASKHATVLSYLFDNPEKIIDQYKNAERLDPSLPKDTFQESENARVENILFNPKSKEIPKDKDLSRCKLFFHKEDKTHANILLKKALLAYEN